MRRPLAAAIAAAALAAPAVVLAQGGSPAQGQYELPSAAPTATPAPPPPKPALGRSAVLEPVSGRVGYLLPGSRHWVRLREPAKVPMGSTVNSLLGRVRVIVASDRRGHSWRSVFFDGKFHLEQQARGERLTTLTLAGGSFKTCKKASASRRRPKRVRRLWGDGHGRFRTSGRYSAATVRGTRWLVEDRCDGTLTRVARGEVEVEDFAPQPQSAPVTGGGGEDNSGQAPATAPEAAPQKRIVRLRKGGSYVARPR
jgi:hypothetical protein